MSLKGKVAVVTGSNSGIGLGIAEALARAGADVALNSFTDRPEDHALAARIASDTGVRAVYVRADMANGDDCRALVAEAAEPSAASTSSSTTPASSTSRRSRTSRPTPGTASSRSTSPRPSTPPPRRCR